MFRSVSKIRKNPDRARAHVRAVCAANQILDTRRGSSFVGKGTMTAAQLDYMLQCAKETRAKKTW